MTTSQGVGGVELWDFLQGWLLSMSKRRTTGREGTTLQRGQHKKIGVIAHGVAKTGGLTRDPRRLGSVGAMVPTWRPVGSIMYVSP